MQLNSSLNSPQKQQKISKVEMYSDTRKKNNNFFTQVPKSQADLNDQQGVRFKRKKRSFVDYVEAPFDLDGIVSIVLLELREQRVLVRLHTFRLQ